MLKDITIATAHDYGRALDGSLMLSTGAAAKLLGIHPQTLRRLANLGQIPAVRLGGKRMFAQQALQRYVDGLPLWTVTDANFRGTRGRNN